MEKMKRETSGDGRTLLTSSQSIPHPKQNPSSFGWHKVGSDRLMK